MCSVALLGGSFLLDINQVQMEVEVKMSQFFCYEQLSFSMVLFSFSFWLWNFFWDLLVLKCFW
jgi:hypothetical protein